MKKENNCFKKFLSIILVFCMLVSTPHILKTASALDESVIQNKVADPSTMDAWKQLFGTDVQSTKNAGGVWTDKSVFVNADAFSEYGIEMKDENGFLAALSVIASNKSVSGLSNVPTDTMIMLDLSSSMYPGRDPSAVNDMVSAVNKTITDLQVLNIHNRVGVVIYFGGETLWESSSNSSKVLLPLDRYTQNGNRFLKTTTKNNGSYLVSIDVNSGVKNSKGVAVSASHSVKDIAGTYAQLGILDALNQFLRNDIEPEIPADAEFQPGVARVPVMVLMSDGEPTAATNNYTVKENFKMGNNQIASRNPAETDFVTQLTAAYAKNRVDEKYVKTTPIFYTLSLGNSISMDIMDPKNNDILSENILSGSDGKKYTEAEIAKAQNNRKINGYWDTLLTYGEVTVKVENYNNGSYSKKTEYAYPVKKVTISSEGTGKYYPDSADDKYYVDEAFVASNASSLTDAFKSIVDKIALQSRYLPTLVEGDEDLDGYVTFTDKIGKYMNVTDIKGIIIGNHIFTGADLASNFVPSGGLLGTVQAPSALGKEMVHAVQVRLGISDIAVAETLIWQAYKEGQLSYKNPKEFSNYIGWYANSNLEFLGFWHEGIETMPDPSDNNLSEKERPAYIIKSYGYLGEVDKDHGVEKSDMMYATVQVRKNIESGEETVVFSVPAALIPMVNYDIMLEDDGSVSNFSVSGAKSPMRLVYEIGLNESINEITLKDVVDREYLSQNTNEDGSVNFYTNQYEVSNKMGYGTVNTYSYFRPSHQNEMYYFQEDTLIYELVGDQYVRYEGDIAPSEDGEYYQAVKCYKGGTDYGIEVLYRKLSAEAVGVAKSRENGTWYVPIGTVHVNLEGYTVYKTSNPTNTLKSDMGDSDPSNDRGLASVPFVDIYGHHVNEIEHSFVVGATLGNNGRISVVPATGLKISKSIEGTEGGNDEFTFVITSDSEIGGAYSGIKIDTAGTKTDVSVQFENGVTTISLKNGESLIVYGLEQGRKYNVSEVETVEYIVKSVNGDESKKSADITLVKGEIAEAAFVNMIRGTGDLAVTKIVKHDLGNGYQIPENKSFEITITLSGVGSKNTTYKVAHSNNPNLTSLTTDENGAFPVIELKDKEQVEIFDLPSGVFATVSEKTPPSGFTATYTENGSMGDGIVQILNAHTAVEVVNVYDHGEENGNSVKIGGTKHLVDEEGNEFSDWGDAEFTIVLEKHTENGWTVIDSAVVNDTSRTFAFDLSSENYISTGIYSYQIREIVPTVENKINGMLYDPVYHTFSVVVTDEDMADGLEISRVHSEHSGKEFSKDENENWIITTDFTNVQYNTAPAVVRIPIQKVLINPSQSAKVSLAHFEFGLYTDEKCETLLATGNGIQKIEYSATDAVGEAQIDVMFDKTGNYTFYIKEINHGINGMIYDSSVVRVDVVVKSAGVGGRLDAEAVYSTELTDGELVFTNQYNLEKATAYLDVRKELAGRRLTEDDVFTFEVRQNGKTVLSGVNDIEGKVEFDGTLEFFTVGVYEYTVVETSGDKNGITSDKTVYNVSVTVTDGGDGKLKAEVSVAQVVGNVITFKNVYKTEKAEYTLRGMKELTGKPILNDEFAFVLETCDENGNVIANGIRFEAKNFTDGHFQFPKITYKTEGKHYYKIYEIDTGVNGVKYDTTVYFVTVSVTDNGKGALTVSENITANGEKAENLIFVNEYVPAPVKTFIPGMKVLEGRVFGEGQFEFLLMHSDSEWNAGEEIETVTNSDGGKIIFTEIEYNKVGSYYYLVKEVFDEAVKNGITFDDRVYRVRVDVTDDFLGMLHAFVHVFDENGTPCPSMEFVNKYKVTQDERVVIKGYKNLVGRDLTDGEFTFSLINQESGETVIATNFDGEFHFILNFRPEHVGKEFKYILSEVKGDGERITYDESEYHVNIQVLDNGLGGVTTKVEITKGGNGVDAVVFNNKYTPVPENAEVKVEINKTVLNIGNDAILPAGFEFVLENAESGEKISATSDENGKAEFAFEFSEADIGKSFTYKVYEIDGGVENVIYSEEVYEIKITISLGEDNKIKANVTKDGILTEKVICEFVNTYNSTPPADPGDENKTSLWVTLMFASVCGVIALVKKKKHEAEDDQLN